jgi:hypothetical protein
METFQCEFVNLVVGDRVVVGSSVMTIVKLDDSASKVHAENVYGDVNVFPADHFGPTWAVVWGQMEFDAAEAFA